MDVCGGDPKRPLPGTRGAAAPRPAQTGGRQHLPRIVGAQRGVQARLFCNPVDKLGLRVPSRLHRTRLWLSSAGHQWGLLVGARRQGFHGAGHLFRTHPAPRVLRGRGEGTLAGSRKVNAVPSDSTLRVTLRMSRGLAVLDTAGHRRGSRTLSHTALYQSAARGRHRAGASQTNAGGPCTG